MKEKLTEIKLLTREQMNSIAGLFTMFELVNYGGSVRMSFPPGEKSLTKFLPPTRVTIQVLFPSDKPDKELVSEWDTYDATDEIFAYIAKKMAMVLLAEKRLPVNGHLAALQSFLYQNLQAGWTELQRGRGKIILGEGQ